MRKILLTLLAAFAVFSVKADDNVANDTPEQGLPGIVEMLSKVEGYIFVTRGETRDLSLTFTRTDMVFDGVDEGSFADMSWFVYNPKIASVPGDDGQLVGNEFGNTLLRITHDGEEHWYIVFVCPTITVVSPEGTIYTHQKIFNEKAIVNLSQSKDYRINCVMSGAGDITDDIIFHEEDEYGYGYGEYVSNNKITGNVNLTLTLESRTEYLEPNPVRVRVNGMTMSVVIKDTNGKYVPATRNLGKTVIKSISGDVVYNDYLPESGEVTFLDELSGVFFVTFENLEGYTFKIVTRHNNTTE